MTTASTPHAEKSPGLASARSAALIVYHVSGAFLPLANHQVIRAFPIASVVLLLQSALVAASLWLAASFCRKESGYLTTLRPSAPLIFTAPKLFCSALYIVSYISGLMALHRLGVISVVVLSHLAGIAVSLSDRDVRGSLDEARLACLAGMLLGAGIYVVGDNRLDPTGYAWMLTHVVTIAALQIFLEVCAADEELAPSDLAYAVHVSAVPVLAVCSVYATSIGDIAAGVHVSMVAKLSASAILACTFELAAIIRYKGSGTTQTKNAALSAAQVATAAAAILLAQLLLRQSISPVSCCGAALVLCATYAHSRNCVSQKQQERTSSNRAGFPTLQNASVSLQRKTPLFVLCAVLTALALACASSFPPSPAARFASKPVALRLVVITGGTRIDSLYRLLESLCNIQSDGDRIDLDVWIDVPPGVPAEGIMREKRRIAMDIQNLQQNGTFRHGILRTHIWDQHMGLRGQWLDAWHASTPGGLTEDTKEIGLILEDDMQLSPFAWRWLKAAYAAYGNDRRVAGFTVQRATLCLARCPNINGGPDGAGGGFYYGLIGTWGYAPTARSFAKFRRWYYSLPDHYKPYVEGLTPTDWYMNFEKAGTETKRMWEMHHIKYTDTHEDKYTVYVKCNDDKTLGVNYREAGLNFDGKDPNKQGPMHQMLTEWDPDLVNFAKDPFVLNYSAVVVSGVGLGGGVL